MPNGKLQIVKTTFYTIYSDFCTIIITLKCITTLNKQKVKELASLPLNKGNTEGTNSSAKKVFVDVCFCVCVVIGFVDLT